jgi:hypothetical protein
MLTLKSFEIFGYPAYLMQANKHIGIFISHLKIVSNTNIGNY